LLDSRTILIEDHYPSASFFKTRWRKKMVFWRSEAKIKVSKSWFWSQQKMPSRLDQIAAHLFFSFGIFWCLRVEHRASYLLATHKKSYAHTRKIRCGFIFTRKSADLKISNLLTIFEFDILKKLQNLWTPWEAQ